MIAFTDVHYQGSAACAAAVLAPGWDAQFPASTHATLIMPVAEYVSGSFWERELPCLRSVLAGLTFEIVVVDGYVWLDGAGRKGLGAWLHDELGVPVVGIAKTPFDSSAHAREVFRGVSGRPLWVTAAGIGLDEAVRGVQRMHGEHRIPTLLALADGVARAGQAR